MLVIQTKKLKIEKSVNSKSKGLSQGIFHAFQKAIYMEENK
jgi:hypothetical protein